MRRRTLIAGNWKMNGLQADSRGRTEAILQAAGSSDLAELDLLICPPATMLAPLAGMLKGSRLAIGGQDCHADPDGAHTGDISAEMLADLGCTHVIVGHSERRQNHGETDMIVWEKAGAAYRAGLTAIVCVGESEVERERGDALEVIDRQVRGSVPDGATADNLVIAYEPVWAIGSGRTPSNDDIVEVHRSIRATLDDMKGIGASIRILYGGSVKPTNAAEILALEDVDGALIGGASLKAEDFLAIARSSS